MAEGKEVTRQIEKAGGAKLCSLKDSSPVMLMNQSILSKQPQQLYHLPFSPTGGEFPNFIRLSENILANTFNFVGYVKLDFEFFYTNKIV